MYTTCVKAADGISPGKQLVFVTNNSTKSRADYKKKFDKMGITASVVCLDNVPFTRLGNHRN